MSGQNILTESICFAILGQPQSANFILLSQQNVVLTQYFVRSEEPICLRSCLWLMYIIGVTQWLSIVPTAVLLGKRIEEIYELIRWFDSDSPHSAELEGSTGPPAPKIKGKRIMTRVSHGSVEPFSVIYISNHKQKFPYFHIVGPRYKVIGYNQHSFKETKFLGPNKAVLIVFDLVKTHLQYSGKNAEVPMEPKEPGPTMSWNLARRRFFCLTFFIPGSSEMPFKRFFSMTPQIWQIQIKKLKFVKENL